MAWLAPEHPKRGRHLEEGPAQPLRLRRGDCFPQDHLRRGSVAGEVERHCVAELVADPGAQVIGGRLPAVESDLRSREVVARQCDVDAGRIQLGDRLPEG